MDRSTFASKMVIWRQISSIASVAIARTMRPMTITGPAGVLTVGMQPRPFPPGGHVHLDLQAVRQDRVGRNVLPLAARHERGRVDAPLMRFEVVRAPIAAGAGQARVVPAPGLVAHNTISLRRGSFSRHNVTSGRGRGFPRISIRHNRFACDGLLAPERHGFRGL
jgi:hypothetical protein